MTEQQVRQFVAHDLRSMPVTGSCDVKNMILGVKAENHSARGVGPTRFWQLMKIEGTAALYGKLPAYFVHRIGIRYLNPTQLLFTQSLQSRLSAHVLPVEHERSLP
ncbi:hypothetical protein [Streptomyces diastaticus]|uniref:hypothetical protein n=1 Tax=Streptomyces diastaticus TaxID=1956 RepID=UPI00365CD6FD